MIALDEQALVCDLAEVYHIFDYRSLPVKLVATLSSGLGDNSRIKKKARNETVDTDTFLMAIIADRLARLEYVMTGGRGDEPKYITEILTGKNEKNDNSALRKFASGAEFMKAWEEKMKGGN